MLDIKVTLRLSSKVHTLEELKTILGEPTRGFSVGDEYARGARRREFTLWSLESSRSPSDDLESHLDEILLFLRTKNSDIKKLSDYQMDIFCMLSTDNGQGGALLKSGTLGKISDYGLDIVLDVYGDGN